MAKPELGTKRLCAGCGAKFYDLGKSPIVCPKCNTVYEIALAAAWPLRCPRRSRAGAGGGRRDAGSRVGFARRGRCRGDRRQGRVRPKAEDDIEVDETLVDDDDDRSTFIPEEEEGKDDVTDIIGDRPGDDET